MTSTGSRRGSTTPSKSRSPEPSRTGTKSRTSSSITPAASAWHGRRAAGDVDSAITCGLRGARKRGVETVDDEIERRPARELDRLVLVARENEDRSVVRRLVAPP